MSTLKPPAADSPTQDQVTAGQQPQLLQRELATYRRELARLLHGGHAGHHALLKEDQVVGIWDTQQDALRAGRERFGLAPFAVKKIDPKDVERFITLDQQQAQACRS